MITTEGQIPFHLEKLRKLIDEGNLFYARLERVCYKDFNDFTPADQEFYDWWKRDQERTKKLKSFRWRLRIFLARVLRLSIPREPAREEPPEAKDDHLNIVEDFMKRRGLTPLP